MGSYPIMLNIKDKDVVVVGGGQIAYRKIIGLLQADAKVTVISPSIHEQLKNLSTTNKIMWKNKSFEPADLTGALLIIAATNSRTVNEFVRLSAHHNQLINVVDAHEKSNFIVPAKLNRGKLTISVATDGASPILAKAICENLATIYDASYQDYLQFLAVARNKVKQLQLSHDKKRQLLKEITGENYRQSEHKQTEFLQMLTDVINQQD